MNLLKRILKIISSAIFTILIIIIGIIVLYIVRVNFLASNDKLGEVKVNFYTILTQSMYPTIKAGDVVITYKNDNNRYNPGDVITFISDNNGGITVTHRINEIYDVNNQLSYKTKGDNNNTADNEIISSDNVLGKVVFRIPKAGFIQQFLVSKTGWIVAIILPAAGIIIYDVMKVVKNVFASKSGFKIKDDPKDERRAKARKKLKEVIENEPEE